jgi:hypothetical protein
MDGQHEALADDDAVVAAPHDRHDLHDQSDAHDANDAHDLLDAHRSHDAAPSAGNADDGEARDDTPNTAAAEIAAALAARVLAHHRLRHTLFDWMHAERLATLPYAAHLPTLDSARTAALADAWLTEAGLPAPALLTFATPDAALVLLPPAALLIVLRLRALLDFADAVQGWIDRPRRALLNEWLGAAGARLLLTRRRELGGESSLAARLARAPSLASALDADAGDALAWRGLRHFARECDWAADAPLAVLQFALPPSAAAAPLATPTPAPHTHAGGASERTPSMAILAQLPALFAETTW